MDHGVMDGMPGRGKQVHGAHEGTAVIMDQECIAVVAPLFGMVKYRIGKYQQGIVGDC